MTEHTNGLSRRAFIGGAVALGAASIVAPSSAFAATAAEKQAEADAVRNQLVGLQADLEAAADSYKQALDAQEVAQAAMEAEQVKIDEANGKIADLQDKLGTRARSMYRTGSSSFLDFVMGASSFEEFTQNWDLLNKMNENDGTMVDETKTLREEPGSRLRAPTTAVAAVPTPLRPVAAAGTTATFPLRTAAAADRWGPTTRSWVTP